MADDQRDVIAFLEGKGPGNRLKPDEIIQTHAAIIALYPREAFKIKRAVKYDYLDFSTLEQRQDMLLRELELNGPAAPGLYRDVAPITKDARGRLRLGGTGEVVEWVLRMTRFPVEAELSVIADQGRLTLQLAEALGRSIADYHARAAILSEDGAALVKEIIEELDRVLSGMTNELGGDRVERVLASLRHAFDGQAELMQARGQNGWVRRCHGDLHLHNIVLWNDVPTPFDALEFDERLGTCDVLYDLAFLLMDLAHRGLDDAANVAMNAYLSSAESDDHFDGLAMLPLYLAVRAAIRAMVDVQTAAFQEDPATLVAVAGGFMEHALDFLRPEPPVLVAIGGLSGSGKTSLAKQIAAHVGRSPGAVHIRSDLERKAYFGVDPLERLPKAAYAPQVSGIIYDRMREIAKRALSAGQSVILDSVHATPADRTAAYRISSELECEFHGFWLDLDTQMRVSRVQHRARDASDADAEVAQRQADMDLGDIDWIKLDASRDIADLTKNVLSIISNKRA